MSAPRLFRLLVADDEKSVQSDYLKSLAALLPVTGTASRALEEDLFGSESDATLTANRAWEFEIVTVSQGVDAIAAVEDANRHGRPFAVAFLDVRMPPGIDGVETAAQIRTADSDINIVIVTAYSDTDLATITQRVLPAEKLFYLTKPFHPLEIQQFAHALAHKWRSERALRVAHRLLEQRVDDVTLAFQDAATARERAEQLNLAKASIAGRIGVELRSPLNVLVGFSQMIANETHGPIERREYIEYARHLQQAAGEIVKHVDTVLETARFDRDEVTLDKDRLNITDVIDTLSRDFRRRAEDKKVAFDIEAHGLDRQILADIIRLRQALGYLLLNAFEASPSGARVLLRAAEAADGVELRIEYQYSLGPSAPSDKQKWSGLRGQSAGLFIAQRILEMHGASIWVSSAPAIGTAIAIGLPIKDAVQAA
jgi:signal transduction histidine kinase